MNLRPGKTLLVSATATCLLTVSLGADARAIRIDEGGWTDPLSSLGVIDIGFNFNFFGTSTSSLTINPKGSVSFGGAVISPFLDDTETTPFTYSKTTEAPFPGIPNAFRVQWGSQDDEGNVLTDNLFQLAIFDLANDVFAMEFNYAQIKKGSDTSMIGYDNGAGTSTDLLADLGAILGLGGSLPYADYQGAGAKGTNENNVLCESSGRRLACNNYSNISGMFGPGIDVLPSGDFGAGNFFDYFQKDPSSGVDAQGRYFFLIDNRNGGPVNVPEPGTLSLLGLGLVGLGLIRRRRQKTIR